MPTFRILSALEARALNEYDYAARVMVGLHYTIDGFGLGKRISVDGQTYEQVFPDSHWFVLVRPQYKKRITIKIPTQREYGNEIDGYLLKIAQPIYSNAYYSSDSSEEESPSTSDDDDVPIEDWSRYDGLDPDEYFTFTWEREHKTLINGINYVQVSEHLFVKVPSGGPPKKNIKVKDMIWIDNIAGEDGSDDDLMGSSDDDDSAMDTSGGGRRKKSRKKSYRKKRTFRHRVSKKRKSSKQASKRCRKTKTKTNRRKTRRRR